jgi:hypothetical protein
MWKSMEGKFVKKILSIAVIVILAGTFFVPDYFIPTTRSYRITVEIETPEGIKTGSAVRRLVAKKTYHMGFASEVITSRVHGEAVPVDLGERGVVFLLATSVGVKSVFHDGKSMRPDQELAFYRGLKVGDKAELKTGLPTFVMFTDMDDPKSVRLVKGYRFNVKTQKQDQVDDFEELLGKGVRLKSVTVEITNDDVTWEIENWLPWLNGLNGHYLHGGMTSRKAPLGLHAGNFKTGSK